MIIGNKNHISFKLKGNNPSKELANLDFYLGSKLISKEAVYLPTYISAFQDFLDDIINKKFKNKRFEQMSDEKVFKTLFKERNLDETQFFKHLFNLDETIDQYSLFIFQKQRTIKFIWECWDCYNCNNQHELHKIYSVNFQINELVLTVEKLIKILKKQINSK